jgi:hypothetical protein
MTDPLVDMTDVSTETLLDALQAVAETHRVELELLYQRGWKICIRALNETYPAPFSCLTKRTKNFKEAMLMAIRSILRQMPNEPTLSKYRKEPSDVQEPSQ